MPLPKSPEAKATITKADRELLAAELATDPQAWRDIAEILRTRPDWQTYAVSAFHAARALAQQRVKHVSELSAERAVSGGLIEALEKASRILLPIRMGMAEQELVDARPVPGSAVVLSFMGSGASDHVTAGEFRAAQAEIDAALKSAGKDL